MSVQREGASTTALCIHGIGVCATGLPDWASTQSVLLGNAACGTEPLGKLDIPDLPVTERRRVNATSRLAIHAALQAVAHLTTDARVRLPSIFASADGDGAILASSIEALAQQPATMSPTLFHNSVFNAPAGYWTIASGASGPSITVSAGTATFGAGMIEAGVEIVSSGGPVLYIAFDMPFPESLRSFGVAGEAFACALLLGPLSPAAPAWGRLEHWERPASRASPSAVPAPLAARFCGNAAAAALPLLAAIAARRPTAVAVRYHDGDCLELAYTP
jgi:beta-ketoacyl synthase-like protein